MNGPRHILIVEDDQQLREQVYFALKQEYEVAQAGSLEAALAQLTAHCGADVVLLDLQLSSNGTVDEGFAVLREVKRQVSDTVVIVMTGDPHHETRLRAIEEGAYDCFTKPFDIRDVKLVIARSLERLDLERENRRLRSEVIRTSSFQKLIGCSPAMTRVFDMIRRVADSPATVLLQGESGTGKELAARAIHYQSARRDEPFVPVHCSALPETLIETELFGHEKGAFTGAVAAREGRFEMAHRGTLFLDEVGTLNLNVQTKLLRVLEERQFERVGGRKTIHVDVRLVAATNEDLETLVSSGRFRDDLFFRLNVLPIRLPPLRERADDIPLLASGFVHSYCERAKLPRKKIAPEAMQLMMSHAWKGNVRELENVIQRAILMADGDTLLPEHLPAQVRGSDVPGGPGQVVIPPDGLKMDEEIARFERELLESALAQAGGVKTKAAKLLGLTKEQMKYLCRKYGVERKLSPEG
ncbi:MAG: sigma-54-dependent Fis family transcriptional regulator [Acidobacteria bacterium]|nr:sigma-54-dependent Fis family transcriptional regulator [Acidobacteriota bacterium]